MPNTRIYWIHTLSPTHAGIGRGVGYIDLPIDRDGVTGWPILRGSSFKGVWRDWAVQKALPNIDIAFGRADKDAESANAGALIPTDAKIVCLPVRSFRGTFAWVTSPLCLQMLKRTLTLAGFTKVPEAPASLDEGKAHDTGTTSALRQGQQIFLEDLDFVAENCLTATAWANFIAGKVFAGDSSWQDQFKKRFVVLPDLAFDFLCETGTEVNTRVRIDDETKTVVRSALWTEESLPSETILMGLIQCERVFQKNGNNESSLTPQNLLSNFATDALTLQIGGKATVGRGQVRCMFTEVQ